MPPVRKKIYKSIQTTHLISLLVLLLIALQDKQKYKALIFSNIKSYIYLPLNLKQFSKYYVLCWGYKYGAQWRHWEGAGNIRSCLPPWPLRWSTGRLLGLFSHGRNGQLQNLRREWSPSPHPKTAKPKQTNKPNQHLWSASADWCFVMVHQMVSIHFKTTPEGRLTTSLSPDVSRQRKERNRNTFI